MSIDLDEVPDDVLARHCAKRGIRPTPWGDLELESRLAVIDEHAPTFESTPMSEDVPTEVLEAMIRASREIDGILNREDVSAPARAQANMRRAWLKAEGLPTGYEVSANAHA